VVGSFCSVGERKVGLIGLEQIGLGSVATWRLPSRAWSRKSRGIHPGFLRVQSKGGRSFRYGVARSMLHFWSFFWFS